MHSDIRIITVSGRIASGSTTLAHQLAKKLGWKHVEGGEIFWEAVRGRLGLSEKDTDKRPDKEDKDFDHSLVEILKTRSNMILETKLAGYNAQGIEGVFKILVLCNDKGGNDQTQIRIDRLTNRENISLEQAKQEVLQREKNDIAKWKRLYGKDDPNWTYLDPKYYDLVINTYENDSAKTLQITLSKIGHKGV
jgi:cytidylate kinase